ncbi:MAG TPA: FAD-dependent oxidoreductase [Alphaproteobacteria bacterium]|nr:FAD-dependent oxidoreductase [Alphaproteobacteria bacterium]
MKYYDVIIVGGGVSGAALLYTLSNYTNIKNIAILEKTGEFGSVNSKLTQNSQTLHFGDIETNYTLEKSIKVKHNTDMLRHYLDNTKYKHKGLFTIYPKMVIAVGDEEIEELSKRYEDFKKLFPKLKKIGRDEIAQIEPNVIKGRDPNEKIIALYSEEGYTVDFGKVAEALVSDSKREGVDIFTNTKLRKITRKKESNTYIIETKNTRTKDGQLFEAPVVIVTAGAHSILIAQSLGYGTEYGILSVAGSFYNSHRKLLNGKVYTMQKKKLPFAAVHGDPEVHNPNITRFGPTAKAIFMLERRNYGTVGEYFRTLGFGWKQIATVVKLGVDPIISRYMLRNLFYDWPIIGKRLFLKEARKVVPTITAKDLYYDNRYGGNRPQIVNINKRTMDTGEAKIVGENIIFNITPSPGASTCLGNAYIDAQKITEFLHSVGINAHFDKAKFEKKYVK